MSGPADGPPVPQYPIEAVDRTLRVLTHLGRHRELKLSEIRSHLGVGQSTAHRLMAMLVYRGFATQDPDTRAYRRGPALFEAAAATTDTLGIARVAGPVLERLADRAGETVHLGVLSGTAVRYVAVVESAATLRVTGRVGRLTPAHATSLGKAMLATYDDARVQELYAGRALSAETPATLTDLDGLLAELGRVRARGWARNRAEMEPGVCSVGVGIAPAGPGLRCGLSIATPQARSGPAVEREHAALLVDAAAALERTLGDFC